MLNHKVEPNDLKYAQERGFDVKGWQPCPRGEGGKINPQVTKFKLADGKLLSIFHIKPVYYETIDNTWRPLEEVCSYHGNRTIILTPLAMRLMSPRFMRWLQVRQSQLGSDLLIDYGPMGAGLQPRHLMYATDSTFYPDASPESNTVDYYLQGEQNAGLSEGVWNNVHDSSDGLGKGGSDNATAIYARARGIGGGGAGWNIIRSATLFDTSSIDSGDNVDTATYSLYQLGKSDDYNDSDAYVTVVQVQTMASDTAVNNNDFDQIGDAINNPTEGVASGDRSEITGSTNSAYTDFTLNATGRSWVAKSGVQEPSGNTAGITYLGIREGHDTTDNYPGSTTGISNIYYSSADTSGTSQDPKLAVTHTAGGGGGDTFVPIINIL